MEYTRSVTVTYERDTNKRTITKEFSSVHAFLKWLKENWQEEGGSEPWPLGEEFT
jgi:hypothetical protein